MNYKNTLLTIGILTFLPSHSALHHAAPAAGAGAGARRLIAPPGGLAIASSENEKEKKEKIDKAKAELAKFVGDHNWKKRKEIITKAVAEDGIDPDALTSFDGSTPLYDALFERDKKEDFEFARLLLTHGANPNKKSNFGPYLENAKTVKMAQLLFDHGAHRSVAEHGAQLLQRAAKSNCNEPELIEWYVQHGVDPNKYYEGSTPLLNMIFLHDAFLHREANILRRIRLLMQTGALLEPQITCPYHRGNGCNVALVVKSKLQENQKAMQGDPTYREIARTEIASLNFIREALIAASHYRHDGLKADLTKYSILLPVLCDLVVGYYIALEPRYEELEAMPVPPPDRAQALINAGGELPLISGLFR